MSGDARQYEPPNFIGENGSLYLVRCYVCAPVRGRENWAVMVASGTCAWCGWKPALRVDRTTDPEYALPDCLVCGMPSGEWHHWAPRAIFPDWPDCGVYLCTAHHREWHAVMRAHGLRYPHELKGVS